MKELWNNLVVRAPLVARLRGQTPKAYDTILRCYRDLRHFIRVFLTLDAAARLVVRHRSPTEEFAPFKHVSEIRRFLAIAASITAAAVGFIIAILGPVEPQSGLSVGELTVAPVAVPSSDAIVSRQSSLDAIAVKTVTVREKPSSETNAFRPVGTVSPAGFAFINDTSNSVVDKSAGDKFDLRASAALYEESSDNPGGQRYKGSTTWRLETGMDEKFTSDPTVHALVEIPQHMQIDLSLRPNPDPRIPASHFIEIRFNGSEPIASINGIISKDAEQATGKALALQASKVEQYFLILMSGDAEGKKLNLDSLSQHNWSDIPIVYASGKRAIITFEKGASGQAVFRQALQAWTHIIPTAELGSSAAGRSR